jgi:hypothetical protein
MGLLNSENKKPAEAGFRVVHFEQVDLVKLFLLTHRQLKG